MANNISRSSIVNSLVWKFLERIFSQGMNLFVQIILARLLLPKDFGSLALIVAITNYAAIFVQSGLATTIVQRKNLHKGDVSTLLTSSLVVAGALYVSIYVLSPWISSIYKLPELVWPLRILAFVLFLNGYNSVQTALLQREMKFKALFWRSMLAVPISGTVGIVMAYTGFGLWALVAQNIINMAVTVIVMYIGSDYPLKFGFNWTRARNLYSFGGKILLTSLVTGFGDTFRTLLIGKKYDANELAYYNKGNAYSNYITQIVNATLQSVMLPAFAKNQDDIEVIRSYMRKSLGVTAFVMFPILFGVIATAKPLVLLFLTAKWAPAIPFLMIYCFLRLPSSLTVLDKQVFYALGKSHIGLYYEIGLLIANIAILLLTMEFSVMAMAVGITVVEYIGCVVIYFVADRVYHYRLSDRIKDIWKPLLNSMLMFFAMKSIDILNLSDLSVLLLQLCVGLICYILGAIILRDENIKYLISVVKAKHFPF